MSIGSFASSAEISGAYNFRPVTVGPTNAPYVAPFEAPPPEEQFVRIAGTIARSLDARTHKAPEALEAPAMRLVASGILVGEADYAARFGDLPIDEYRDRMPPEVFEVFVRFAGLVEGSPRLDVVAAARLPEE